MSLPIDLTPQTLTTSNILLLVFIMAKQFEGVEAELAAVRGDRNIASARPDTLSDNWGTLLQVSDDALFTPEKYRSILQGIALARRQAPTKAALRQTVLSFAPTADVRIVDYWKDPSLFVAPDPDTFFRWNNVAPGNVWNHPGTVWAPGMLLRRLGLLDFGSQVQVLSLADESEIQYLRFVPSALEFVRPAHEFVALTFEQEVLLPI